MIVIGRLGFCCLPVGCNCKAVIKQTFALNALLSNDLLGQFVRCVSKRKPSMWYLYQYGTPQLLILDCEVGGVFEALNNVFYESSSIP